MAPSISVRLVDGYLGGEGYMPDAAPDEIPATWRTLRTHELQRSPAGVFYKFTEYLPDLERLGPVDDASAYAPVTDATFAAVVDALKAKLGKPARKQKQQVEFEWGGPHGTPTWGGVSIKRGQKQISLGGGDAAPWGIAYFTVEVLGVAPT